MQTLAEVLQTPFGGPFGKLARMAGADHDAVLFDLDGVLVDSRAAITGCINHALVEHEFAARPPESLHRFIGPSLADAFAELTDHPSESAVAASCLASYRERYAEASLQETVATPGIEIALGDLSQRYRLAVSQPQSLLLSRSPF